MRIDSPNLFYIGIAIALLVLICGKKLRWPGLLTLFLAMLSAALSLASIHAYTRRELRIVALIDLSPSTRGATFRTLEQIQHRLDFLTSKRNITIQYFASGATTGPNEVNVNQTVLPPADADAVLLYSDGQFDLPDSYPPTYPVIDPALENPDDAKIINIEFDKKIANIFTSGKLADRSMRVEPANPSFFNPDSISGLTVVQPLGDKIRATLNTFDPWPENDRLTAITAQSTDPKPLFINQSSDLPREISDLLSPAAIVVSSGIDLSTQQIRNLGDYVNLLGGSLILSGSPADFPPAIRQLAPLSHQPPQQPTRWIFLLDASGSMGQKIGDTTRWEHAIASLRSSLARIDDDESISLLSFNWRLNSIIENVKKSEISQYIDKLARITPTGETGLQSSLETSLLGAPATPTRLILITDGDADLKDPGKLIQQFLQSKWTLYLLATGDAIPNPKISQLVQATGGSSLHESNPANWTASANQLLLSAMNLKPYNIPSRITTSNELDDLQLNLQTAYPAFARNQSHVIAQSADNPIIATWNVGYGKVSSIAAAIDPELATQIASRLRKAPTNPNYQITLDPIQDQLVIRLITPREKNPDVISMERITGNQSKKSILSIESPGVYRGELTRMEQPSVLVISVNDQVIDRRAVPGHYPREYDFIGNNRSNLTTLANRTRGKIIEPADDKPIDFPGSTQWLDLSPFFAAGSFLLLLISFVLIRGQYLFR